MTVRTTSVRLVCDWCARAEEAEPGPWSLMMEPSYVLPPTWFELDLEWLTPDSSAYGGISGVSAMRTQKHACSASCLGELARAHLGSRCAPDGSEWERPLLRVIRRGEHDKPRKGAQEG